MSVTLLLQLLLIIFDSFNPPQILLVLFTILLPLSYCFLKWWVIGHPLLIDVAVQVLLRRIKGGVVFDGWWVVSWWVVSDLVVFGLWPNLTECSGRIKWPYRFTQHCHLLVCWCRGHSYWLQGDSRMLGWSIDKHMQLLVVNFLEIGNFVLLLGLCGVKEVEWLLLENSCGMILHYFICFIFYI